MHIVFIHVEYNNLEKITNGIRMFVTIYSAIYTEM